jgi:hypothetical protein
MKWRRVTQWRGDFMTGFEGAIFWMLPDPLPPGQQNN